MSTFGTALVLDVPTGVDFMVPDELSGCVDGGFQTTAADGWQRHVALLSEVELHLAVITLMQDVGTARCAVAEDNDEYGALWWVARADGGVVTTLHRRYVLNADPQAADEVDAAIADLGRDPRADDVAGVGAAQAVAETFGAAIGPVVDAETASGSAWEEIGTVGGPFPWWTALGLPWPVPAQGEPLGW